MGFNKHSHTLFKMLNSDYLTLTFALSSIYLVLFSASLVYFIAKFNAFITRGIAIFVFIAQYCFLMSFINMAIAALSLLMNAPQTPEYLPRKTYLMSLNNWVDFINYFQYYL